MTGNPYASPDSSIAVTEQTKRSGFRFVKLFMVTAIIVVLIGLLLPSITRNAGPSRHRTECRNNLRQIARALHSYQDTHLALPPAYTTDASGKPLHSWRTLILPHLDQQELYTTIDLSKPWHDPANAEALKNVPYVFRCPAADMPPDCTTYMAIVAPNSCFRPSEPRLFSDMTDGTSQTLMVIEVASEHAFHWMSPQDADEQMVLDFGTDSKQPHTGGTQAAFVDGSVHFLSGNMTAAERRALISISGGDNDKLRF